MDDDKADACAVGSRVAVRRTDLARQVGVAAFVDREVSARGGHGGQWYSESFMRVIVRGIYDNVMA